MNALLSLRWLGVAGLLVACVASGCGKSGTVPTAPVSGVVTLNNVPLTAGQVTFHPVGKTEGSGDTNFSGGTITASGMYEISTGGNKGAPLGKYKVTVNPSMVPAAGGAPVVPFNRKFQTANNTTLDFEVVANPAPGRYDLKLTK